MLFDFVIVAGYAYDRAGFWENMVEQFADAGHKAGVISAAYDLESKMQTEGIYHFNVDREALKVTHINKTNYLRYADEYCNKYNLINLKNFCFAERAYYMENSTALMIRALRYFKVIEDFLSENQVKCFIQHVGGDVIRRVVSHIARYNEIPTIYLGASYFPNKMLLHSDEMNQLEDFQWCQMGPNEEKDIDNYIESFIEGKKVFKYTYGVNEDTFFDDLRKIFYYIHNNQSHFLLSALKCRAKNLRLKIEEIFCKGMFSRFDKNSKYIYMPLNAPNDSVTTIRNPQFYNQVSIVEYLSRHLPQGHLLYVKEHPGIDIAGQYFISQRRAIAGLENVCFLLPDTNSHQVIQNSRAVVIISSTVGFEALHYFKPVIVLGNWPLRGKGVTIDVDNLSEVPQVLAQAVNTTPDREKIKSFLFSLKESMYDGSIYTSDLNYRTVVNSLIKKANHLQVQL